MNSKIYLSKHNDVEEFKTLSYQEISNLGSSGIETLPIIEEESKVVENISKSK